MRSKAGGSLAAKGGRRERRGGRGEGKGVGGRGKWVSVLKRRRWKGLQFGYGLNVTETGEGLDR